MLNTYRIKGPVMIAKQTPWMHPWLGAHKTTFQ